MHAMWRVCGGGEGAITILKSVERKTAFNETTIELEAKNGEVIEKATADQQ